MKKFKQLTLAEREKLYALNEQGVSQRDIAKRLNRDQSTLSRELARNSRSLQGNPTGVKDYLPIRAQRKAVKRKVKQRSKAPLKNPQVFLYVREHLRPPFHWTPEQIEGRISLDLPGEYISYETIYQYIYSKKAACFKLWQYLPQAKRKRLKKLGRKVKRDGKIPGAVSIDLRAPEIEERKEVGHWETDNLEGLRSDQQVVSVTVERKAKYSLLTVLKDRKASSKTEAVTTRLKVYPPKLRQTLTADNGKENSYHYQISTQLQLAMYFCHTYHSWEKGTVENTNLRLRRFLPKGKSLDSLTAKELQVIESILNNTPRKCLGFRTPAEVLSDALQP